MNNHQPLDDTYPTTSQLGPSRKYPWAILVVLILFVVIPFLAWYGSWFGRPLSDAKMEEYLHDQNKPRNVQHALAQIGNRVISGDQSVKRWYSDVINASHHQQPEVRLTAAWVMGRRCCRSFKTPLPAYATTQLWDSSDLATPPRDRS